MRSRSRWKFKRTLLNSAQARLQMSSKKSKSTKMRYEPNQNKLMTSKTKLRRRTRSCKSSKTKSTMQTKKSPSCSSSWRSTMRYIQSKKYLKLRTHKREFNWRGKSTSWKNK
eukprot:PhF_6_TR2008/c1_g1_i2/m.3431